MVKCVHMHEACKVYTITVMYYMYVHVGSENVANSLVEKTTFINLVHALNPCYPVPLWKLKWGDFLRVCARPLKFTSPSATAIHFTTDIWTKKGSDVIISWNYSTTTLTTAIIPPCLL